MNALLELLAERCVAIGVAVTAVLVVTALALACSRNPLHRERTASWGIVGAALAFVLMLVPMPGPVGQLSESLRISVASPTPAPALSTSAEATRTPLSTSGLTAIPALAAKPRLFADQPDIARQVGITEWSRAATARTQESTPLPETLATAAIIGTLAMLAYLVFCTFLLARLARRAGPLPEWLVAALPASGRVQLLLCQRSQRPFCFGLLRSHVVLPADLVRRKNTALLRCVVQHELAHVQLGHLRWRKWIAACSVLLYAHPLYWWLARQQREAAELLADDQAAGAIGKARYVEQLIGLVEQLRSITRRPQLPLHLPMSALGAPQRADGPFYHRMKTLLMRTTTLRTNLTRLQFACRGLTAVAVLSLVTIAVGRPAFAQEAVTKIPAADEVCVNEQAQVQGADEEPQVLSFTALLSVEGVGQVLCNVADNGIRTSDLVIGPPDEDGKRRVSFRILQDATEAITLTDHVVASVDPADPRVDALFGRIITDESTVNQIDASRETAYLDTLFLPFDEHAQVTLPPGQSATDVDLAQLLHEVQLSNQLLRDMVLELQRNVAALQEKAQSDFDNF